MDTATNTSLDLSRNRTPSGVLKRSAIVGILASLADLGLLALLIDGLQMSPAWANLPALTFGLLIQFIGNKHYAFRDRSPQLLRQGSLFLAVETGAFLLNAALFHLLSPILGLPWILARALATSGVYFGFSYPLWGRIFRPG